MGFGRAGPIGRLVLLLVVVVHISEHELAPTQLQNTMGIIAHAMARAIERIKIAIPGNAVSI